MRTRSGRHSWLVAILSMLFIAVAVFSCASPFNTSTTGQVVVNFGSGSGSRAPGVLPGTVASIDIAIKAADMAEIKVTMTTPSLSATIEVPAGASRSFDVTAKDSSSIPIYHGLASMDIEAGAVHDLSVTMAVLYALSYEDTYGATGTPPTPVYREAGKQVTVAVVPGTLVRTGYAFSGWNTASDGSGTPYAPGALYTMPASDAILFAQWTVITYTVTFDSQGGSAVSPRTGILYGGIAGTLMPTTRSGYTFANWNTLSGGGGTVFDGNSTPVTADITVYAQWTANPSYTVTFNINGGSTGTMTDQSIISGTSANLTSNGFGRPGYTFAGWSTGSGVMTPAYMDGASYTMGGANVTLYAQWTAITYTVTFDSQGGSAVSPRTGILYGGIAGTLMPTTRSGYTFTNWNTLPGGGGTVFDGNSTPVTADIMVYAQWTLNTYTVTFDGQGATTPPVPLAPVVNHGTPVGIPSDPRIDENAFGGWYIDAGCTTAWDFSVPVTATMTLYAKWTPASTGLQFTVDGSTYKVSIGTATDTAMIIPDYHLGDPVTTIETNGFSGFASMISVNIPKTITSVENNAFMNCTSLATVLVYPISPPLAGTTMFAGCTAIVAGSIKVPGASLTAYSGAVWWSTYSAYMMAQ